MRAVQYPALGSRPQVVEVERPEPGPGQVLLRVTAAGVCHSDLTLMSYPALPFDLPLTLGHEGAGVVEEVGGGASGVSVGESVLVYGSWGCGVCRFCALGEENRCRRAHHLGIRPPGLGAAGSIAEYMVVDDVRHLVPIGDLDPVATVPLTDAGLTPYHAIRPSLPGLVPGSTAVVIGTGGLGHMAIQILRALTPARVVALDVTQDRLDFAASLGAHETVLSDADSTARVRELTGGTGADVVLDFVGIQATADMAVAMAAMAGDVAIVGIGGGLAKVGFPSSPTDITVRVPYWGTRSELVELVALAHTGVLDAHVERFALDDAVEAYERLESGRITGRAVIVPGG
jgi:alcohol dehydrogenase, propanol-preferring